jgi:hypothetical protein
MRCAFLRPTRLETAEAQGSAKVVIDFRSLVLLLFFSWNHDVIGVMAIDAALKVLMGMQAEPDKAERTDPLEAAVEHAIALCDGDVRAALRAALVYNEFLERKLDMMRGMVSSGYTRGKVAPARGASAKLDEWREVSAGGDRKDEPSG